VETEVKLSIPPNLTSEGRDTKYKTKSSSEILNPNSMTRSRSGNLPSCGSLGSDLKIFPPKRKITAPSIPSKHKLVETGILSTYSPIAVEIRFENAPVWLFALHPSFVEKIYFPMLTNEQDLSMSMQSYPDTLLIVKEHLSKFRLSALNFNSTITPLLSTSHLSSSNIVLISGSLTFLDTQIHSIQGSPFMYISEKHIKIRRIPQFRLRLHRLKHEVVGGASKFESLWCTNIPDFLPQLSTIRRDIACYIDHSIRPTPVGLEGLSPLLTHQYDRLHPQRLDNLVLVNSDFTATGFGKRNLTDLELGAIFGFPSSLANSARRAVYYSLVPIQILDALFKPLLNSQPNAQSTVTRLQIPLPIALDAPIFLHSIAKILPSLWWKSSTVSLKAAKDDDAKITYEMWDLRILSIYPKAARLLPLLRAFLLRRSCRRLFLECVSNLRQHHPRDYANYLSVRCSFYSSKFEVFAKLRGGVSLSKDDSISNSFKIDLESGRQILRNYVNSSFFAWSNGSSLIHWRWTPELRQLARIGFKPCIISNLPKSKRKAKSPKKELRSKLLSKILKVLERGYMEICDSTEVSNFIDYFSVPKGESDIRVVYNGSSCGLNNAVWAPNFWLPTAKSMVRVLSYNFRSVDIDLGEMFLNFPLHPFLSKFSGVDLSPFTAEISDHFNQPNLSKSKRLSAQWKRDWMGFKPSPEWACRYYYLAEEFVRGNERDSKNPLYWTNIVLNLIGNENFNPGLPNVFKWDDLVKNIAGEIMAYVDDLRATGRSLEHAWAIARQVAAKLQYLGIQDAARKRRIDGGPWAGTIFETSEDKVQTTVSNSKWVKGREYIKFLESEIKDNPSCLFQFKLLEKIRGYLCHLAMTYNILFPYLKGFHLTLCTHLPKRDEEGWKLTDLQWIGFMEQRLHSGKISQSDYDLEMAKTFDPSNQPIMIKPVPRFHQCLKALSAFFKDEAPPIVTHRSKEVRLIAYGFADASKGGFGASMDYGAHTHYRVGVWGKDTEDESSNYRELANIVETIEEEVNNGKLTGATLVMATDNTTVESSLYKGNTASEKLFDLMVRFRQAELRSGGKFIVTHVSGERMKSQGTDGISRGQLKEGVSVGDYMLTFCPWGKSALDRSGTLREWISNTFGSEYEFLEPNEWYTRGHDHDGGYYDEKNYWRIKTRAGKFVWFPPPAAAEVAIEELRKSRLKRRESTHLLFIPRLATTLWLKQLNKACDIVLHLPNKYSFWNTPMHEPLVLGICFPFLNYRPWQLRSTPKMFAVKREMHRLFGQSELDPGNILFKFVDSCQRFPVMQRDLVQALLYFERQGKVPYLSGGDHQDGPLKRRRK